MGHHAGTDNAFESLSAERADVEVDRVRLSPLPHVAPGMAARTPSRVNPEAQARSIVEQAHETARQMLDQARTKAAQELAAARERGYAEGHALGTADAERDTASVIVAAERIALAVAEERDRIIAESEREIITLALSIAERVVDASIRLDPDLVIDVCRGAMRKAFARERLTVLAHPDDLDMLRAAGPSIAEQLGGVERLDFVEERRLERGDVVVRTPAGEVDATRDGKIARISDALLEEVERTNASQTESGESPS